MTLTEFLLARIAEDEGVARGRDTYFSSPEQSWPARTLAECEAKRRIVDLAHLADEEGAAPVYDRAVRALAAVYADHPDYCDEWRP